MNTIQKNSLPIISALVIILVLIIIVGMAVFSKNTINQPIAYSHKIHVDDQEMLCTDCHVYAEEMAAATIPTLEVCQTCHSDEPISESPEELKLLNYIKEGKEIPWKRVYNVPDHVYFSHRRHVVDGELDCAECHGKMAELTEPVSSQFLPVTMVNCMDCHKERKVSTDCLTCHH